MFIGEYKHSIDNKNRIIVPSKFREKLKDRFILTKGLDNCLFIHPSDEWILFEKKLRNLPLTNKSARRFVRFFLSGAVECKLDKQGRIVIPASLINYSSIDKEVCFIGMSNKIEIWSSEEWDKYNAKDFDANELASQMEELGI